jgi:apolipoprotein N-acyltransferase
MYPPFFLFPLGFVIFPYFISLISKKSYEKSFFKFFSYGFVFGFGFLIIYLSWIRNPFLVYETTRPYTILSILLPIFLSIFFGLGFLIYKYFKNPVHIILATPFIFISIEFLISNFFYGFPWISNSLILSNNLFGFYIIKYFGTLTSGYLIILIFLLPTFLLYKIKIMLYRKLILIISTPFLFVLIISIIYSFFNSNNSSKEITIDAHQILSPINKKNAKEIEKNIINIINNSKSDYIFFGENNFPYLIDKNNYKNLTNFIKNEKKVIIGATTYKDGNYYNSLLLIEKNQIHFFDKKILVPFGEFLPFRKYLKFMEMISGTSDFKIGKIDRILTTKDNIKILPIICYEIIFDQIFKNINKKQIDILVNITNDSWFGNKIGPYQHFYISRIKSLIANKPLVRVSNNGISAIIDNNGKIIKSSKLNQVSNINYKFKINNNFSYFPFHKFYSYYLLFIFIFLLIFSRKRQNEK